LETQKILISGAKNIEHKKVFWPKKYRFQTESGLFMADKINFGRLKFFARGPEGSRNPVFWPFLGGFQKCHFSGF
jgi:hypothetical protein